MSDFNIPPVDINQAVTAAMNFEYKQQYRMQVSQNTNDVQLSIYSNLKSLFSDFQKKLTNIQNAFNNISLDANASNSSILSNISINNNNVSAITHTIEVTQLARSQVINSAYFSNSQAALNTNETLTLSDENNNQLSIAISTDDTLESIKTKINNNTFGLKADIIASTDDNGNNQYHLVITTESGTKNQITITGDNANLFQFNEVTTAKNAEFKFDGHNVVRSSNTINDVLDGVSFRLSGIGSSDLEFSKNTNKIKDGIKTSISDMIASYNQLMTFLDANQIVSTYNKNDDTYDLQKNHDFNLIKSNLQFVMNGMFQGNIGSLYSIGIKLDKPKTVTDAYDQRPAGLKSTPTSFGNLILDDATLDSYLTNQFDNVKSLFSDATNGVIKNLNHQIDDIILKDGTGIVYNSLGFLQKKSDQYKEKMEKETERMNKIHDDLVDRFIEVNKAIEKYRTLDKYLNIQFESFRNSK